MRRHELPASWIIHTVGPIWHGGNDEIRTIAFPAISTGAYGYPKDAAAMIAVAVMRRHESAFDELFVCVMDDENRSAYREALSETPSR